MKLVRLLLGFVLSTLSVYGQANGKLQLHFMDVGQGDGILLISPQGQTVLIDGGTSAGKVTKYLETLHVTNIDYYIASHYHDDHIKCSAKVLSSIPLKQFAFDRGDVPKTEQFDNACLKDYVKKVAGKRKLAIKENSFKMDTNSSDPVSIDFITSNGNGIPARLSTIDENDLSVVFVVWHRQFSAVFGGDLSGKNESQYTDIETSVSTNFAKPVTVYKVNHHGASYSSNPTFIKAINPVVGVISCGDNNTYGHPTADCLSTLYDFHVDTYWTEYGKKLQGDQHGASALKDLSIKPKAKKHHWLGRNIVIQSEAHSETFSVTYGAGQTTRIYRVQKPTGGWSQVVSNPGSITIIR